MPDLPDWSTADLPVLARLAAALAPVEGYLAFALQRAADEPTPEHRLIARIEFERYAFARPKLCRRLLQRHETEKAGA